MARRRSGHTLGTAPPPRGRRCARMSMHGIDGAPPGHGGGSVSPRNRMPAPRLLASSCTRSSTCRQVARVLWDTCRSLKASHWRGSAAAAAAPCHSSPRGACSCRSTAGAAAASDAAPFVAAWGPSAALSRSLALAEVTAEPCGRWPLLLCAARRLPGSCRAEGAGRRHRRALSNMGGSAPLKPLLLSGQGGMGRCMSAHAAGSSMLPSSPQHESAWTSDYADRGFPPNETVR